MLVKTPFEIQGKDPFPFHVWRYSPIWALASLKRRLRTSGVPRNFVRGGVQQIQLRTEDRQNGDMGAVAPESGVLEVAVTWYVQEISFHIVKHS